MINAVILAGDNDKSTGGLHNKATCMIGDKMMIQYVIDALKKSQCIDQIVVVGSVAKLQSIESNNVELVQCGSTLSDNILRGIEKFQNETILISTSDIPMISDAAIRDFVIQSLEVKADLTYSVVSKETMLDKFPQAHRTYVKLKDGEFTGGNLFVVQTSKVNSCMDVWKKMIMYRKSPWKMCRLLGINFLVKLVLGRLSILDLENRVAKIMDIKGKAIISNFAEVGNDVDKLEDLEMTAKYMGSS